MPKKEKQKILSVDNLRHAEYYDMQNVFDSLYAKSKNGDIFENLVDLILKRENILLAYRNIKNNTGSHTVGTDNLTINDIGKLSADDVVEKVRKIVFGSKDWGYRPRPVRRKEIPKPNGSIRPLGIPCIWDRLVQQCIKQIMEPICEAKFSNNSYGFRPNRSVENAIAAAYKHMQCSNLHYVVEFDIQEVLIDGNKFIIEKIDPVFGDVSMRDTSSIYPINRVEKIGFVREHLKEEETPQKFTTEKVAEYPAVENGLPYDIVVEKIKTEEPALTPPVWEEKKEEKATTLKPTVPESEKHNYRITDDNLGVGGAKEKFRNNMAAINLLKELEFDDRLATPEEQEVLSKYVGFGGLADAFDESKENWADEYKELKTDSLMNSFQNLSRRKNHIRKTPLWQRRKNPVRPSLPQKFTATRTVQGMMFIPDLR